ncbi:TonB-linked SusC/RagA family outer membrane protein [Catalinimonas alkaloidigena]|uniref:SusC/RagA family TonB-linked outer membrane protein n=1 Tax=Catalinimonas alkaloidigena TaxID=1075417 RepID=UPI002404E8CB|nr:SusC/RagA family TonB-linked outer membrane protein [Catalinimonas alkaloidigena]MDF9795736.1 TonB-linked SusC/RagA family outer membrane protein [Catalinimonas alkaloidigena]
MKVKFYMLMILLAAGVFSAFSLMAQSTVSGKITSSEDENPLPGVNIIVKGTTIGTVTDIDGNYRINVPEGKNTLSFSFIGYVSQDVPVNGRNEINVVLNSDAQQLSEVVVTAVNIEREKRALGYAVTDLDGEKIAQKAEPDPVRALQGKVPGVNIIGGGGAVAAGTNITIRGNSSLLGNNQPLFVVDGVPFDNSTFQTGSFSQGGTTSSNRSFDLDPNNIESMTVLKGAAASALYGSRAANGVIVITTKAGRKGTSKGLEVTYNGSYSVEQVSNLPDYQFQYMQGNNFKYVDGNFGTWGAPFDTNHPAWQNPLNADLILGTDDQGRALVAHPYDRYPDRFPNLVEATVPIEGYNTPEAFFRNGYVFENAVTVSAGNEKANFTAGASRTTNEGIVPNNSVTRTSVNVGGNATLENGIFINGSINYVNTDLTSPPITGLGTAGTSVNERLLFTPPNVNVAGYPIQDAEGNSAFYRPDNDNPYWLARYAPHTSKVDRYYGKVSVGYDLTDWLTVQYQAGFNAYTDRRLNVIPAGSSQWPVGLMTSDDIARSEIDGNLLLTANTNLTEDIGLKVIAGHNANQRTIERQSFQGTGIIVRGIHDMDNLQTVIPNRGGFERVRYQALFADVGLSYKNWAFLNLVGRNDWHSGLPEDERSFFYSGVSGSFVLTDALEIESGFLDFVKIRAGLATSGNDLDPYLTRTVFVTNSALGNNIARLEYPFNSVNVQSLSNQIGNADLKPEFTTEFEVGAEIRLLDNRIGIDFTYYDRWTRDQIVPIDVAPSTGYWTSIANIGQVSNTGVEVGLDLTPIRTSGGFSWNIFSAFTKNKNTVDEIGNGLTEIFVGGFGNAVRIVHREGEPYGQILGSVAARHTDGQLLVDPGTGKLIEKTEFEIIGDPNPDFILGVTNTFSWKGLSLNVLVDWRKGGDMYSDSYTQIFGRGLTTETIPDGPRGREVTLVIPGVLGDPSSQEAVLDENGQVIQNGTQLTVNDWFFINSFGSAGPEEFAVFDASTIRLREVTLSYELPNGLLERTPFGSASIAFTGRNLWYEAYNFPKSLNLDPETSSLGAGNVQNLGASSDGSGNAQGIDFGVIPTTRRFGVNLRLTF